MITLSAGAGNAADIEAISTHLREQRVNVLGAEQLLDEGAIVSEYGESTAPARTVVERETSTLRAVWIVDLPSRAAALDLLKQAPGGEDTLEVRESYTPQDFGAPPDPNPPTPPPPPVRKPDTHRYIALVGAGRGSSDVPTPESMAKMDVYCAALLETNTMLGGEGLKSSAKGTRLRRSAQQRLVLDGPFAESKELVGGYMLLQVPTLEEAIDTIRPWLRIHREGQRVSDVRIEVRRLR